MGSDANILLVIMFFACEPITFFYYLVFSVRNGSYNEPREKSKSSLIGQSIRNLLLIN